MYNPLCKYKDIFGVAGDPTRFRVYGIAIRDVVATFVFVCIISYLSKVSFWVILGVSIVAMVFFHRIFCVRTATDKLLFPNS